MKTWQSYIATNLSYRRLTISFSKACIMLVIWLCHGSVFSFCIFPPLTVIWLQRGSPNNLRKGMMMIHMDPADIFFMITARSKLLCSNFLPFMHFHCEWNKYIYFFMPKCTHSTLLSCLPTESSAKPALAHSFRQGIKHW